MPTRLVFKGDKKPKKRKRSQKETEDNGEGESSAVAKQVKVEDDDAWVTMESQEELAGPVMFTFNADTPVALSCDPTGKVFLSPITQIEKEDLNTAEPSDVQQVWVIHRVYDSPKYSIKSHHGKYLGVDKYGVLSATREAISPEEEWVPIRAEMNTGWSLQSCRDLFMGVDESKGKPDVRADREVIGFQETWTIRGQGRFKKKARKTGEEKKKEKITRKELEELAGFQLDDDQVKTLKRAKREGNFNEALLDVRASRKHDKFS